MRYSTRLLLCFVGLAIAASSLLYVLVHRSTERVLFSQIQTTVRAIAISTALEVDGDRHDQIRGDSAESSKAYRETTLQLRAIRDAHRAAETEIAFIYTFRPSDESPEDWIYVADAEEEASQRSEYGDDFEFEAANKKDLVFRLDDPARADLDFTTDQYGHFLSAHAPVRNAAGEIVARLGVDFNASDVRSIQHKLARRTLLALAVTSIIGLILSLLLSRFANEPLRKITRALEDIGMGNLDTRLNSERSDEFGMVERAVDSMANSLEEKKALQGSLSRYVTRDIAQDVAELAGEHEFEANSTRKRITVLFCDIDDSDEVSSGHSSEIVVKLLNAFFSKAVATIFDNGGTLDRFYGAGLMATFGTTPKDTPHEQLAITTALKMQQVFSESATAEGISLRIGIHTGEASVGDGSSRPQMAYKAIGEVVNVAARIAAASRKKNIDIIASADTVAATGDGCHTESIGPLNEGTPSLQLFSIHP